MFESPAAPLPALRLLAEASDRLPGGALLHGLIALVILFVIIVWICFPFLVVGKFNDLIREVRGLRAEVRGQNPEVSEKSRGTKVPSTLPPPMPAAKTKEEPRVYKID